MTREEARTHWSKSGLTYEVLGYANLRSLRSGINKSMISSAVIGNTMRAKQRFTLRDDGPKRKWADLRCRAYYFEDRQAITFEPDGFVGFAGWSDDENVKPILTAFCAWVDQMKSANPATAE